jgi:hypothetical protein
MEKLHISRVILLKRTSRSREELIAGNDKSNSIARWTAVREGDTTLVVPEIRVKRPVPLRQFTSLDRSRSRVP